MGKGRLEAFSDGVIAILITIMVLELKVPHDSSLAALDEVWPILLCYVLSFLYIAIYWNNHHHMMHAVRKVDGPVLWANTHLLFWLSLIPFTTAWMGENHFATLPVSVYGFVLFMAGLAYFILERSLLRIHTNDAPLAWVAFEHEAQNQPPTLKVTTWPGGEQKVLARAHPHGTLVHWLGD